MTLRLSISAESAAIQQCFSLTINQRTVLSATTIQRNEQAVTCKKMRSAIANYWWGSSADSSRIHWMSWERLTQHKSFGGMGFRHLHLFNKAMLGKQGWRLITRQDSICARILKRRYYHDGEFMDSSRKKHAMCG
jgi:hypothetical protein